MKKQHETPRRHTGAGPEAAQERRLARRGFLKATGALLITAGLEAACRPETASTAEQVPVPPAAPQPPLPTPARFPNRVAGQYPAVPDTPSEPPTLGILYFFTLHEAQTVEALTARILPGTPDDPGAREAGVVHYIDFLLSHREGFAQPIYRGPPFAEPYSGSRPPKSGQEAGGYQTIWVAADELPRYGYQSALTPRDIYRRGLVAVDQYAMKRFGSAFKQLPEDQQDEVVEAMANGEVTPLAGAQQQKGGPSGSDRGGEDANQTAGQDQAARGQSSQKPKSSQGASGEDSGYYPPSLEDFFLVLRTHTIEGMFADPLYGGNRNLVGWKLLGYPGAQRAYTAEELQTEGTDRQPQSIADLPRFHPGRRANNDVLLPVTGSDQTHEH